MFGKCKQLCKYLIFNLIKGTFYVLSYFGRLSHIFLVILTEIVCFIGWLDIHRNKML